MSESGQFCFNDYGLLSGRMRGRLVNFKLVRKKYRNSTLGYQIEHLFVLIIVIIIGLEIITCGWR